MEIVNRISSKFEPEDGCRYPSHESLVLLDDEGEIHARQLSPDELQSLVRVLERVAKLVVDEQRFNDLARRWKTETKFLSNVTSKSLHTCYQKIIGMGEAAVPFILKDLKENGPNHWFWALNAITDENLITDEMSGNMKAMTEVWLQWGNKVGYLRDCQEKTKSASQIS